MEKTNYGPDFYSINPFLPCYEYVPDGEPHIFGDRIYLYGSHDKIGAEFCCVGDYVCWSAHVNNPGNWKYEGVIYKREQDPYGKEMIAAGNQPFMNAYMFAPDVVKIEGEYFLYYGIGMSSTGIGVAKSDNPTGPFQYIGRVRYPEEAKPEGWTDSVDGINDDDMGYGGGVIPFEGKPFEPGFRINGKGYPYDPAVLYENGHIYLYYGLSCCYVVELDVNDKRTVRCNVDGGYEKQLIDEDFVSPQGMKMANGPSIRNIGGKYYLSFFASGNNNASGMCYAVSDSPVGPFEHKGILVTLGNAKYNGQENPTDYTGNTHGGMVRLGGTWYQIYHRHTNNNGFLRQACAVALSRNSDGDFEHAEHTSLGFSKEPLGAYHRWPAYMACYMTDNQGCTAVNSASPFIAQIEYPYGEQDDHSDGKVLQVVTNTTSGSVAGYKYFDFGSSEKVGKVTLTLYPKTDGYIDVYADSPMDGEHLARVEVNGEAKCWAELSAEMQTLTGVHSIYFVFNSIEGELCDFAYFEFE